MNERLLTLFATRKQTSGFPPSAGAEAPLPRRLNERPLSRDARPKAANPQSTSFTNYDDMMVSKLRVEVIQRATV